MNKLIGNSKRELVRWRKWLRTQFVALSGAQGEDHRGEKLIFLFGCGRSGTTFLSEALGKHPDTLLLVERREIWHRYFPELNVRTRKDAILGPGFIEPFNSERSVGIRRFLDKYRRQKGKKLILEKLPLNSFRMAFLREVFPEARFIYIERNGLDVAKSIQIRAAAGWWGKNENKWRLLKEYAKTVDAYHWIGRARNHFDRGLMEWRLSTDAAHQELNQMDPDGYHMVSYEKLVRNFEEEMKACFDFIGLTSPAFDGMELRNTAVKTMRTDALQEEIGGERLKKQLSSLQEFGIIEWERS